MSESRMEAFAWACFAGAYPHEAAEMDWPRLVALVRERAGWEMPEATIRENLAETAGEDVPHAQRE